MARLYEHYCHVCEKNTSWVHHDMEPGVDRCRACKSSIYDSMKTVRKKTEKTEGAAPNVRKRPLQPLRRDDVEPGSKKMSKADLVKLLVEIQRTHLHEADTDAMQFCKDCSAHPYHDKHKPWCLVDRLRAVTGWRAGH